MPAAVGAIVLTELLGVSTIAGFAVSASTYAIVGNVVLAAAAIGANYALAPGAPEQPKPSDGQLTTRQALPGRRRSYGRVKVGGPLMFSETKDGQRLQVIAINQGRIFQFEQYWFGDTQDLLTEDGHVANLYRFEVNYLAAVDIKYGTDTDTAFAGLTNIFPEYWTDDHRGRGIAKFATQTNQPPAEHFTKVYPGGAPPVVRVVIRAVYCWDFRDPAQDPNDESTWVWTMNPVVMAMDFHRHKDGMALNCFDETFFTPASIAEDWIPAANICDEMVPQKTGSPYGASYLRYQCSGGYDLPNHRPKDVLTAILATCDGECYQRPDGAIGIRVGKTIGPTVLVDDSCILSYDSMKRGSDGLTPINKITAKYTDPILDFQETDADPWIDDYGLALAGREESRDVPLLWVQQHQQARRLMKVAMARANPEWSGQITTNLSGLRAYGERYIHVRIDELLIDGTFEVTSFELQVASATCAIGISALDQSAFDFDPETEEGDAPAAPNTTSSEETIEEPEGADDSVASNIISVTWDAAGRLDATAGADYSVHGADNWFPCSIGGDGHSATTPVLPADHYDIRVRWNVGTRSSEWVYLLNIVVT